MLYFLNCAYLLKVRYTSPGDNYCKDCKLIEILRYNMCTGSTKSSFSVTIKQYIKSFIAP